MNILYNIINSFEINQKLYLIDQIDGGSIFKK